jgi:hypothetical protein
MTNDAHSAQVEAILEQIGAFAFTPGTNLRVCVGQIVPGDVIVWDTCQRIVRKVRHTGGQYIEVSMRGVDGKVFDVDWDVTHHVEILTPPLPECIARGLL